MASGQVRAAALSVLRLYLSVPCLGEKVLTVLCLSAPPVLTHNVAGGGPRRGCGQRLGSALRRRDINYGASFGPFAFRCFCYRQSQVLLLGPQTKKSQRQRLVERKGGLFRMPVFWEDGRLLPQRPSSPFLEQPEGLTGL